MKKYNFEKDENGLWYIVLHEWTGDKSDLQMVCGADTMLDLLALGEKEIELTLSTTPFDHEFELNFNREEFDGGWYNLITNITSIDLPIEEVWLCKVTKFVFGYLPENIYIG